MGVNRRGLDRLVHWLRGIKVGVALGGGAARGMAHLGVLRTLEREGIPIDAIAGTSAGAMTGILYGAGFDPDFITDSFVEDLEPGWFFRSIPSGKYWYLMYNYRRGRFGPMLRKYLHDWRLEQLSIPCSAISVDLVRGEAVVRRDGDAVDAILDSINLPVLAQPILRPGQALIDGGFLNNVPADVLVSHGCNLVIAVDVMARIQPEFGRIRPDSNIDEAAAPGVMPTLMRTLAVQSASVSSVGAQPADVRIEPDTRKFGMASFTRAHQLSEVGAQAATRQLPEIRRLLTALDGQMFPDHGA